MLLMTLDIVVKFGVKPYILGEKGVEVYIKYHKKFDEKFRKHGQKHKRLDFFEIFAIISPTREIHDVSNCNYLISCKDAISQSRFRKEVR